MKPVFVDTGAWIALLRVRDARSADATAWYRANSKRLLLTTNYVLDEAATRLRYDGGLSLAIRLRTHLDVAIDRGRLERRWIDATIEAEAWSLLERYPEVPLSFTDATSAVVARRAKAREVFGFDGDFRALGFELVPH
jgi:predicted nucleic acid-binding protein